MDWRARKYYAVTFSNETQNMNISNLKLIGKGIRIHFRKRVPQQPDEIGERSDCQCVVGCKYIQYKDVEYELNKAKLNDDCCRWKEIKRDLSKKYFDVHGNIMPFQRCQLDSHKRCNRCLEC